MIYNVTHNNEGKPLQSVRVSHRLAIGKKTEKAVTKLDHFVVSSLNSKGEWELDEAATAQLAKAHGVRPDQLNAVRIFLLADDPEAAFKSELALRSGRRGKILCKGNGMVAIRRENLDPHKPYQPWSPCGESCPELADKQCKPSGGLYFQLAQGPLAGKLCMLHTGSWNSVRDLSGAIASIRQATGGLLRGIPLWLTVLPRKIEYGDGKTTTIYTTNIEYRPQDPGREAAEMIAFARAARGQVTDDEELDLEEFEADERYIAEMHYPDVEEPIAEPEPEDADSAESLDSAQEPRYVWSDVPEKHKAAVFWYLQNVTGKTGKAAVENALANARLSMDQIVEKALRAVEEKNA